MVSSLDAVPLPERAKVEHVSLNSATSLPGDYYQGAKAPDALLRLGQSLAALKEKEAACAAFGEVTRKYPRASAGVKSAVDREQKRVKC